MSTRYLFSPDLFDIFHNTEGWWFKPAGRDAVEGPFASVTALSKEMGTHLEEGIRQAYLAKYRSSPP
jgi:hypothetical protein